MTDSCMLDRIPHARVFRQGGAEVAPPSRPIAERLRDAIEASTWPREAIEVVIGLWPLTIIMIVAAALIWSAGT